MRLKIILVALVVASIGGLRVSSASATVPSASNITVQPFLQELKINPADDSKQFKLVITNGSKSSQIFHLSAVDFGSLDETGGLTFQGANVHNLNTGYGLAKWISLDKNDFQVAADQQASVNVTVKNDSELQPGAHYAAIIVTASNPSQKASQLTITPKVSSLIFATKTGGEQYDMHMVSLSHNGSLWHLPTTVSLRFKSTGNTYIVPRGIVSLKQTSHQFAKGIINPQSSIVLPGTIRIFDVPVNKIAPFKKGLLFTTYQIQADYRYDGESNYATHIITQKVINSQLIGVVIILVIAGLLIYKRLHRNR